MTVIGISSGTSQHGHSQIPNRFLRPFRRTVAYVLQVFRPTKPVKTEMQYRAYCS